jgi:hypothetical protein
MLLLGRLLAISLTCASTISDRQLYLPREHTLLACADTIRNEPDADRNLLP